MIALFENNYALTQVNGIFDAATERAVTDLQNQNQNTVLKESATGRTIPSDPTGVIGPFTNAQFNFSCGLVDIMKKMMAAAKDGKFAASSRYSTTQNFTLPSSITVLSGQSSVSSDRRYRVTVQRMIEIPSATQAITDADVTILAGAQKKRLILKPGELSAIGSLTLLYQGSTTGTFAGKNISSTLFAVNGARFQRFQTDRNLVNAQAGGVHLEAQQSDLDLPVGEAVTSTDGQYRLIVNRLVPDSAPSKLKSYQAEMTIQVGNQTEHAILKSGDTFSAGDLKLRYSGYSGVGDIFANFFAVSSQ